jgi:hypothetical protein
MVEEIIINSLMIIGIHIACYPDMLFEAVANELDGMLPPWLRKPLYDCVMCMASFWGIAYLLYTGHLHLPCYKFNFTTYLWDIIKQMKNWPIHILSICGLNAIINFTVLIPAKKIWEKA